MERVFNVPFIKGKKHVVKSRLPQSSMIEQFLVTREGDFRKGLGIGMHQLQAIHRKCSTRNIRLMLHCKSRRGERNKGIGVVSWLVWFNI
jgi:hypothetical protein